MVALGSTKTILGRKWSQLVSCKTFLFNVLIVLCHFLSFLFFSSNGVLGISSLVCPFLVVRFLGDRGRWYFFGFLCAGEGIYGLKENRKGW